MPYISIDSPWCLSSIAYWAEWKKNDEAVLYLSSTGETVLVSLLTISVLESLKKQNLTLSDLMSHLSPSLDGDITPDELKEALHNCLGHLQQLGVIEQCPQ